MAKRALINREHQIYRMANGRWYARPTIPGIGRREYALGDVSTLPAAIRKKNQIVARVIEEAAAQRAKKERDRYSSLVLCDELVDLRASKADATYEQTEIFFRKHIKPFLEAHCPDARELRPVLWERYKNAFRLKRPTGRLFNHWKFWTMLFKYAHEKGILDTRFKLPFDEGKEDSRARGQKIPDDDFRRLYLAANQTWKDRMVLGRLTGQRPGLIRKLRKDQVDLMTGIVNVQKKDSKNRRGYAFRLPDQALEILRRRSKGESPYFFPSEANLERPMGN
ncbi:MAG TPA: hypothetical protein VD930_03635, partial [Gemmatimonadales bacterium]|nr:hypothetical protein [Gemmatimonadales bacterium]